MNPIAKPPSLFTFGCMSLGKDLAKLNDHIHVARTAMDAGVWFHASPTYNRGFTYMVLRMAFDEARSQVPPIIIKIRCGTPRLLRFEVEDALVRMSKALDVRAEQTEEEVTRERGAIKNTYNQIWHRPQAQ